MSKESTEKRVFTLNFYLLKVSNGTDEYPGNFTSKENKIIINDCKGKVLHLFSGKSDIGDVRVDYVFGNVKQNVFDFLKKNKEYFDTIIIDAPYNQRFADKYQKIGNTPKQFIIFADTRKTTEMFEYINEIDPDVIILKSWNYYCLKRYYIKDCYICYAGGYRKPTFLIVMWRRFSKIIRKKPKSIFSL